jgi:hypothetical protein
MRKTNVKPKWQYKPKHVAVGVTVAGAGIVGSTAYAVGMTETILATSAMPGAIATKAVTINGAPYVLSLVKASLLSKIIVIGACSAASLWLGKVLMDKWRDYDNKR